MDLIPEKLLVHKDPLGFMSLSAFTQREAWINRGMYAFVCWQWVDPLARWIGQQNVLEVMAGAGWLAKALREKGVNVIATDDYSWHLERKWPIVSPVEKLGAIEAVKKYGASCDILILSWPYMDDTAFNVINELYQVKPDCLIIYIGEDFGGCTASEEFFDHFEDINDADFKSVSDNYKAWPGLHDTIRLGKFKLRQ